MKMEKTVKFLAVLTTVASLTAEGAEWHVNHEWGDDNWPGTAAQPFKTFKHALLKLKGGDTLHVQKTKTPYTERFGEISNRSKGHPYDGTPEKPTVIEGHGAELTSLTRMSAAAWELMADGTWRTKPHHFLEQEGARTPFQPVADRAKLESLQMYWSFKWVTGADGKRTRDADFGNLYIRLPENTTGTGPKFSSPIRTRVAEKSSSRIRRRRTS